MQNDSVLKTLLVATSLCVICSVLVSSSAVKLKPLQEQNKKLDIKKNLLLAAGLIHDPNTSKQEILEMFKKVETKVIDLETGDEVQGVNPETFDPRQAAKVESTNYHIPTSKDLARIKRRAKNAKVYLVKDNGQTSMIVLPIHGKGLWSTLWGFLALAPDTVTVKGIGFYEHGETPGLGGEVDNPNWKAIWVGKHVYDANFDPILEVVKGEVNQTSSKKDSQVDGLAGATMTSRGVEALVRYWLGENGYLPYLNKFRSQRGDM